MKLAMQAGKTSQSINIFIQDSSSTTGAGLTGLVFNTAGLTAYYALPKAAAVSITLATLAAITTAWSSGGFKEVDATNMPGWYRLDLPDAAIASGRYTTVHLKGATNMAPLPIEIELTAWDNQDAVRGGMTALPNAAAGANGGLPLGDASGRVDIGKLLGTAWLTPGTAGTPDVNAKLIGGTAQTGGDIYPKIDTEIADIQSRLPAALTANGNMKSSLVEILTTALTETAGQLAGGFKKFFNIAAPASTMDVLARVTLVDTLTTYTGNTPQTGDGYARLGAPAGASVSADVAAVKVDTAATLAAVDTEVAAILAAVDTEVASILALLNSARTEPAQGAPPVNPNMATKVDYLYKSWRNKKDNDGTTTKLYADDATTVDHKQATSEAAGTVTKGEWATGP